MSFIQNAIIIPQHTSKSLIYFTFVGPLPVNAGIALMVPDNLLLPAF